MALINLPDGKSPCPDSVKLLGLTLDPASFVQWFESTVQHPHSYREACTTTEQGALHGRPRKCDRPRGEIWMRSETGQARDWHPPEAPSRGIPENPSSSTISFTQKSAQSSPKPAHPI